MRVVPRTRQWRAFVARERQMRILRHHLTHPGAIRLRILGHDVQRQYAGHRVRHHEALRGIVPNFEFVSAIHYRDKTDPSSEVSHEPREYCHLPIHNRACADAILQRRVIPHADDGGNQTCHTPQTVVTRASSG